MGRASLPPYPASAMLLFTSRNEHSFKILNHPLQCVVYLAEWPYNYARMNSSFDYRCYCTKRDWLFKITFALTCVSH